MVTFTIILEQDTQTTCILKPEHLALVADYRLVKSNRKHVRYEFDVAVVNCPAFSNAIESDPRIVCWQAKGK